MTDSLSDPDAMRRAEVSTWRVQNAVLAVFVGAPLGGLLFGLRLIILTEMLRVAFVYLPALGTVGMILITSSVSGLIFGFPPAIITAIITNILRPKIQSHVKRIVIVIIIGAITSLLTDGIFFGVRAGRLGYDYAISITVAGAIAAAVCGLIVEYCGWKVPQR